MDEFVSSSRIKSIEPSKILTISQKAKNIAERGGSIVDLTVGEPDFDTPDHIKIAAYDALRAGKTKYTALSGDPDLVDAVREWFEQGYGVPVDRSGVIVTNGAKQAIYNAFAATIDPGDEVILLAPYWTSYPDMARLEGAVVREVTGVWDEIAGWSLDLDAIERAITPRTRWILLNSPCNPSGAVFGVDDLQGLAEILRRHPQVWLLSDDIYQDIAWPAAPPLFMALHPELAARVLVVGGVSKAYAMTGWRIGWAVGPSAIIRAMTAVQSQTTSAPSSVSQAAAAAALRGPSDSVVRMAAVFLKRRDYVVARLRKIAGFQCPMPSGAFYAFPRIVEAIERLGVRDDMDLCDRLLDGGVAAVPGSAFGVGGYIRFSFATSDENLAYACDRIEAVCGRR